MIHGFHLKNLRGDIFGGVTAAVVALPLALAFGVSSGAGPIAGLYGAICVGLFAALFGGTSAQISGPTGPMTVVMALIFTEYSGVDPIEGPPLAFTVVMMGGALQILLGVLRVGRYISYVPRPVISGFMTGIGVIIIVLQLRPFLGHTAASAPLAALKSLPVAVADPVWPVVWLGVFTLAIVYLTPRKLDRLFPAPLAALLVGTALLTFVVADECVTTLGSIPTGWPDLHMPTVTVGQLPGMIKWALMLALLGSIDSLLTSLVADNITRTHHDSDKELIGQGIGNAIAGMMGGLPGAGATLRTMVNVRAGGRTPISGSLHAVILLSIVLGLGSVAGHIPHVVLAAILIRVGTDIIDWDYLKRVRRSSPAGVAVMTTVLLVTVFVDLIVAVGVGMTMASLVFLKRQTELQLSNVKIIRGVDKEKILSLEENEIVRSANADLVLYHLGGPLSFGVAKEIVHRLSCQREYRVLLLDLSDVPAIDGTVLRAIEDIIVDTMAQARDVVIALPYGTVAARLDREGTLATVPSTHVHPDRLSALRHCRTLLNP